MMQSEVIKAPDYLEPRESWFRSWFPYLKWVPSSPKLLKESEEALLSYVKTPSEGFYVDVGTINGQPCRIWTRKFHGPTQKVQKTGDNKTLPLVMIHGMGAGLAIFALTLDTLSRTRTVFAFDLPGFGRSSRPCFSSNPTEAEEQYSTCIEEWRKNVGLDEFHLLGHSFGGYLTAAYTLRHPHQVKHAVLADPWGMPEKPTEITRRYNIPLWVRGLFTILKHFNPLWGLRASGPAGPKILTRLRPDLMRKFEGLIEEENLHVVSNYLYHCNTHSPSGESAFHNMMTGFAWAKNPMFPRLSQLDKQVPLTVLYGEQSWVSAIPEQEFRDLGLSKATVKIIEESGHHVYADQADLFSEAVLESLDHAR